uniref:Protein UXT n=1 Tax=Ciona savignyi TaxID=51511 RepID=H2Y7J8_CIOSA
MENSSIPHKVLQYETFLNETLRGDLQKLTKLRDKCYEEIAQYMQLQNVLERPEISDGKPLKAQVDLGCNFHAQAVITDPSKIFVCVGYGFYVEFTKPEAIVFIKKRTEYLNSNAQKLSKDMVSVRAQIRMVLEGLKELYGIHENLEQK